MVAAEITEKTWQRFFDPQELGFALDSFDGEELVGITHYLLHPSAWRPTWTCYLEDHYTLQVARGKGVGRALINSVIEAAKAIGSKKV